MIYIIYIYNIYIYNIYIVIYAKKPTSIHGFYDMNYIRWYNKYFLDYIYIWLCILGLHMWVLRIKLYMRCWTQYNWYARRRGCAASILGSINGVAPQVRPSHNKTEVREVLRARDITFQDLTFVGRMAWHGMAWHGVWYVIPRATTETQLRLAQCIQPMNQLDTYLWIASKYPSWSMLCDENRKFRNAKPLSHTTLGS